MRLTVTELQGVAARCDQRQAPMLHAREQTEQGARRRRHGLAREHGGQRNGMRSFNHRLEQRAGRGGRVHGCPRVMKARGGSGLR